VIAAANGIRSIGEFLRNLFLAAGRPSYKAYCEWIGMAVCVALYFLLIPRFGMWGGAIATLATFVVMGVVSVVWTYRVSRYRVEGARLLKLGGAAAAAMALYYAVPASSLAAQLATSALCLALFPMLLWLLRFPTAGEWAAVRSVLQRAGGRLHAADFI